MSARDVVVTVSVIFALGLGFLIVYFSSSQIQTALLSAPAINESAAVSPIQGMTKIIDKLDYIILMVFISMILLLVITSWFIGGNPIFIIFYLVVVVIAVILSAFMSNVWETISTKVTFAATVTHFPITNHLLINLPYYAAVLGFIGLVVMFAKPYAVQE